MMKLALQDLVIRLDDQRKVLQLLVPKKASKAGELRVFYEIAEDEVPDTESLETHIGTTIIAFLSATYDAKSFRIEQYRKAGNDFDQTLSNEAAALLGAGDADSEFEGAMLRLNRFDETWSLGDVDGLKALIERSARNGSEKAGRFLREDWPARSEILKKRLGRGGRSNKGS